MIALCVALGAVVVFFSYLADLAYGSEDALLQVVDGGLWWSHGWNAQQQQANSSVLPVNTCTEGSSEQVWVDGRDERQLTAAFRDMALRNQGGWRGSSVFAHLLLR